MRRGFTIVELLIVAVVIAILAAITIVAYNGISTQAKQSRIQNDIRQVANKIEAYAVENAGVYPSTGGLTRVYYDADCGATADSDGQKTTGWVPGLGGTLPQSGTLRGGGTPGSGGGGCYMYASDGTQYILAAWNMKAQPDTTTMYRRLGFRGMAWLQENYYLCNNVNVGGNTTGTYSENSDLYKYSYIISNISSCDETPPPGA